MHRKEFARQKKTIFSEEIASNIYVDWLWETQPWDWTHVSRNHVSHQSESCSEEIASNIYVDWLLETQSWDWTHVSRNHVSHQSESCLHRYKSKIKMRRVWSCHTCTWICHNKHDNFYTTCISRWIMEHKLSLNWTCHTTWMLEHYCNYINMGKLTKLC